MKEKDEKRCRKILDAPGLLEIRDTHLTALSGGQKQCAAIAAGAELS